MGAPPVEALDARMPDYQKEGENMTQKLRNELREINMEESAQTTSFKSAHLPRVKVKTFFF